MHLVGNNSSMQPTPLWSVGRSTFLRKTLNGRPAGYRLCWVAEKGGPEGCPFLQPAQPFSAARRPAYLCSTQARPLPAESSRFSFGNMALQHAQPAGQCCSGSGFWSPIRKIYEIFLDSEPDWISFLLKPDPDYPKRFEHFLIFLRFVFFLRKFC